MKYSFTCTCGEVMKTDANNRDEAVNKFKSQMNQGAVNKHFSEKHADQPVPPLSEIHAMIEKSIVEA